MQRQELLEKIASVIFPDGPNIQKTLLAVKGQDVVIFDPADATVDAVYEFSQTNGVVFLAEKEKSTAEQWLTAQGYSPTALLTLFDLETRLAAAQKTALKLVQTRAWANSILSAYVADANPRYVWPEAPYSFGETTSEAFLALAQ